MELYICQKLLFILEFSYMLIKDIMRIINMNIARQLVVKYSYNDCQGKYIWQNSKQKHYWNYN